MLFRSVSVTFLILIYHVLKRRRFDSRLLYLAIPIAAVVCYELYNVHLYGNSHLNLAATFSPELSDLTIYVIDVAAGEKIPRKGGPGITKSDLLVINKTDLAPYVGADLGVMERDATLVRSGKPFLFTNCRTGDGLDSVLDHILQGVHASAVAAG